MENNIVCPHCGSTQIYADKKGFGVGKAVAGSLLTGNLLIGAAAGAIGKDKIEITCLNCGYKFAPGDISIGASRTDKYLADEGSKPEMIMYKCSCGKVSSLEPSHPYCPKCGKYLSKDYIASQEDLKAPGCLGIVLLPFILGVLGFTINTIFKLI